MKEGEVLVSVEGLSKKFCKDLKRSLKYGVHDLFTTGKKKHQSVSLRKDEFWAVKDVNFELRRGECLGLIGHNGAGKSTLLKMLNGLINPDEGKIVMRGRVGALIELGAGFNPLLTGRENIYNNGAVLGFGRKEIDEKIESIIDFSEIREFIDMPVQNYSSGMKVRLGFSIAAQMEPDVLIIDEVLAVGDLGFVLKCFKTIDTLLPKTAIVFVSHSMPMVSRICSQVILMERGEAAYQGANVSKAVDLYYNRFALIESSIVFTDDSVEIASLSINENTTSEQNLPVVKWYDDLEFELSFNTKDVKEELEFTFFIYDKEQRAVAMMDRIAPAMNNENGKLQKFSVRHEKLQLSKGIYSITVAVRNSENKEPRLRVNNIISFQVTHPEDIWSPFVLKASLLNN